MFKIDEKEYSTGITIRTARQLKDRGVIDLLDAKALVDLTDIMSNPSQKLDFLWEVVKSNHTELEDQREFENSIDDVESVYKSLEDDVENFIRQQGPAFLRRWSELKEHASRVMDEEMKAMTGVLNHEKVKSFMNKAMDDAIAKLEIPGS